MVQRRGFGITASAALAIILAACGATPETATPTPTAPPTSIPRPPASIIPAIPPTPGPTIPAAPGATATATPAATAAPATASSSPVNADRTALPTRTPDMTAGARSDGWILDAIDASESGGRVSVTLRFEPMPGQAGGPQADAWFEGSDNTYSIAVRGVRGSNLILRPGDVMPLSVAPLRGYYALLVRDDTIFALVVVASRPSVAWSLDATDAPGVLRLTLETR
jgi:hypothetical protein